MAVKRPRVPRVKKPKTPYSRSESNGKIRVINQKTGKVRVYKKKPRKF